MAAVSLFAAMKHTPETRAKIAAARRAEWAAGKYDHVDFGNGRVSAADRTAWAAYVQQKSNALGRGLEFRLTFNEWLRIWNKSGHFSERGRRRGQYVMCRYGDLGAYEVGNVFIGTTDANISAGSKGKPKSAITRLRMSTTWKAIRAQKA
jgi:hypothetical protein